MDVVRVSREAYAEAFRRVTGRPLVALPQLAGRSDSEIFFDALEFPDGRIEAVTPNRAGIPERISKHTVMDLDEWPYPKTPLVPLVPILGILSAVYLMSRLTLVTWTVMIVWLLIGLVIYFGYSMKHSKVQALPAASEGD